MMDLKQGLYETKYFDFFLMKNNLLFNHFNCKTMINKYLRNTVHEIDY